MIKVNLIRNRVGDSASGTEAISSGRNESAREGLIKLACVAIFTGVLMVYESQNLRALNEESMRLQSQVQTLSAENAAKAAEVAKYKDVEVQAKELEDKLKILKLLSRLRLREVKTLDFMQSSIPEKVWLKNITYDSDKVKVESGHFQFSGMAVATEELTEFVRRLEDSAYLQDVIVVKNQEVTNTKTSVRDFMFTAEVENHN